MKKFTAIVLAAGKGVRMNSSLPKVLHPLEGRPLICYVLSALAGLRHYVKQVIVVTGSGADELKRQIHKEFFAKESSFLEKRSFAFVCQRRGQGTARAVKCAEKRAKYKNILVLCADTPLITKRTLSVLIASFLKKKSACLLLSAYHDDENDLGRVLRDRRGKIKAVREKIYLKEGERQREVNSGIYCFERKALFPNLGKIKKDKSKGEYFLTDIIEVLYRKKAKIDACLLGDSEEILGVNTQKELIFAAGVLRRRVYEGLIAKGVKIIDPHTVFIDRDAKIGKDTLIYPFTFIERNVIIGTNCLLGPFIHLREGARIGDNVQLGNFVEICRSKLGKGSKIKHFSYLGDAVVGEKVNIGAGTVAANFDGRRKNRTLIGKEAFVGSDTVFVAPVKVGSRAVTGAGSVVTKDVKPRMVVVGVPAKPLKKKSR